MFSEEKRNIIKLLRHACYVVSFLPIRTTEESPVKYGAVGLSLTCELSCQLVGFPLSGISRAKSHGKRESLDKGFVL